MWTVIFFSTTVICAAGWLGNYIAASAMIYYLKMKNYKPPTEEESKTCINHAAKKLFKK